MATYYLNPYGYDDEGFYFDSIEELEDKLAEQPSLEEYEIELIDADSKLDARLFNTIASRENGVAAMQLLESDEYDDDQKTLINFFLGQGGTLDGAIRSAENATLFEGSIEDYFYDEVDQQGGLSALPPDEIERYFDWESYAEQEAINRGIQEVTIDGVDYTIDPRGY